MQRQRGEGTAMISKRLVIIVSVLFAAIAVTALVFTLFPAQSQAQVEKPTDTTNETIYYLKDYNGRLAVFSEGSESPFKITEVEIKTLPEYDQKTLRQGVKAHGQKELTRLLEDFCS